MVKAFLEIDEAHPGIFAICANPSIIRVKAGEFA
jgi:hypothetical protein